LLQLIHDRVVKRIYLSPAERNCGHAVADLHLDKLHWDLLREMGVAHCGTTAVQARPMKKADEP
jgi:hypothetical protein